MAEAAIPNLCKPVFENYLFLTRLTLGHTGFQQSSPGRFAQALNIRLKLIIIWLKVER